MAILKVAKMGHPVLRKVAEPIDPEDIKGPEIQALINDMFSTMVEYDGAGLAAPQVHVSKQLALVGGEYDEDDNALIRVVINPEIEVTSEDLFGMYEGCLSVPGMRGYVERPVAIKVKALDEDAEPIELELEGYPAVVMQHECDHLQGKLYLDRMKDIRKLVFETEGQRYLPLDKMIDGREV